nr:MAG TPA: hypothetical protein [Caudoviricetes sp.]
MAVPYDNGPRYSSVPGIFIRKIPDFSAEARIHQ